MQPPKLTYDHDELVVKKEDWINLIFGFPALSLFAICLFFGKDTKPFFKGNLIGTGAAVLIILISLYFLVRQSLDNRVKMVINKKGIWTARKGWLLWSNIQYYYFEEIRGEGADTSLLKIRLLDNTKEVKIDISFFNTSKQHIDTAIERNSRDFNIIAL
jgi:hypothetical protein